MNYWENRLKGIANKQYEKGSKEMLKAMKKNYRYVGNEIKASISDLYLNMIEDGAISTTNLYSYGRYKEVQKNINKQLKVLGTAEISVINSGLEEAYKSTFNSTAKALNGSVSFGLVQVDTMQEIINAKWSGKHFSKRIWTNTDKLAKLLEKSIIDSVAIGTSKDIAIKEIMGAMNSGFSNTDRLVRTELMYVINQGQKESYTSNGYTEYKYLAHIDKRTSKECKALNGKIFNFEDAKVGVNYPVKHARCRCTVIPIIN